MRYRHVTMLILSAKRVILEEIVLALWASFSGVLGFRCVFCFIGSGKCRSMVRIEVCDDGDV